MANDAYLQIDGIKGESADSKHREWIEVSKVEWNVHQPRAIAISSSGHTAGRAELSEISFKKLADLSSPLLQQTCAAGKTIPKAKFEFMRADGNGEPIKYYTVELENVMISSVSPSSGESGVVTERVSLAYSKIKWSYTQQKVAGEQAAARQAAGTPPRTRSLREGSLCARLFTMATLGIFSRNTSAITPAETKSASLCPKG